tara:strand:+ start:1691 stop:2329 length:639 start_codon:yes stop_codon:yes gene_type:complete
MSSILLASSSTRRRAIISELFQDSGIGVDFCELEHDEPAPASGVEVSTQVQEACIKKAEAASKFSYDEILASPRAIIVSDTLVEDPDDYLVALGKPKDEVMAASALIRLSGKRHKVWTSTTILERDGQGFAMNNGWFARSWTDFSIVEFDEINEGLMEYLISSRSWFGKAGGYDFAGEAGRISKIIQGEEVTVLGFSSRAISELSTKILKRM